MNYESLVNRIRNKEEHAITEFYNEFYKDVYYVCLKITENDKDAEDVAQEVLFRAINKINLLHSPEGLPAWLRTIANNLSINYIKKNRKFDIVDNYPEDEEEIFKDRSAEEKTPEDVVADNEVSEILLGMIDKLPKEQKITLFMFYFEEMSVREISEAMDCSEATVRSRINYAKKALRKQVEELEDKGVKFRCIAILPFLGAVYSLEKNTVSEQIALPDIQTATNINNNADVDKATNETSQRGKESIEMIKKKGMGLGVKIAVGVTVATLGIGGITGVVLLTSKGGNSNKSNISVGADKDSANSNGFIEGENRVLRATYYGEGYSRGNVDGMEEYRNNYDSYSLNITMSKVVRNKEGYICYYKNEGDERKIVCENPVTKEEIYTVDLTEFLEEGYDVSDIEFGEQYVTMCTGRDIAIDLSTGEVVLNLNTYEDGKGETLMTSAGNFMVLSYQEKENYTLTSYTVYDEDGNTTTPCSEELLKKISAVSRLTAVVRADEPVYIDGFPTYIEVYKANTLERIMENAEYLELVFSNRHCELWRNPQTDEHCLVTSDSVYNIKDIEYNRYTNSDGSEIITGLIYTNTEDGKRYIYSIEDGIYSEVTENFTWDYLINSTHTAMSYKGEDGNVYFYNIADKKEIKLEVPSDSVMIALTEDKYVYAVSKDKDYTFIVVDVNEGKETEIETTDIYFADGVNYELENVSTDYCEEYFEAKVTYFDPNDDMGISYKDDVVRFEY